MTDFTKGRGQGTGAGLEPRKPSGPGGYKSRLDEILAKAGNNNPIAAAQARNTGKQPQAPVSQQPAAPQPPAGTPLPPPMPPVVPQPAAPANTGQADPNSRLQAILAMAGQTPAQRAQSQAQQASRQAAANAMNILRNYLQAVQQDPRKMLLLEMEVAGAGSPDEYYLRCYADASGNLYWDLHGTDIDYPLQNTGVAQYKLHDDYYRGIPNADIAVLVGGATISSDAIV